MLDAAGAGDRQHHGAAGEQPGERDLAGCRGVRGCYVGERSARLGQLADGQREPGDEADAMLLAVVDDFLGLAAGEVVEFCTVATSKTYRAASMSSTETSDRPR
jgi:hypothetical protein